MADYFWGAFFVIALIGLSAAGAAGILKYQDGMKECKLNSDCDSLSYCGSDFNCHSYPNVQQTITHGTDWATPAAILGLAIVIAALILKRR